MPTNIGAGHHWWAISTRPYCLPEAVSDRKDRPINNCRIFRPLTLPSPQGERGHLTVIDWPVLICRRMPTMQRCLQFSAVVRIDSFSIRATGMSRRMSSGTTARRNFGSIRCDSPSHGFAAKEINTIENTIIENQQDLLESWNEFFND